MTVPKEWPSALCGTVPGVAPAGRYPAPSFRGARTFLAHLAMPAAARPSDRASLLIPLRFGKQQREQDHAAFRIDLAIDQFGAEAALERHDRRHRIGDVIAESFEREQEARLRAIVDYAGDGIITIDERGLVLTFNPAAQTVFGFAPEEIVVPAAVLPSAEALVAISAPAVMLVEPE